MSKLIFDDLFSQFVLNNGYFVLISLPLKEYRKRNASGAVYDDPRVAVGAGRFDEVGAAAEA